MKPFWVTFYSYKGGVGRSLALANVAALLVERGRRVLLIDFDLEAPGLDSFTELAAAAGKPGVVEYVSEFLRNGEAPDIRRFVHPCELPGPLRGQLCVMPSGRRDAAYNHQLARINWAEFYENGLGAPFFANWKAAIEQEFQPDYIFIDSRTGLTEVGGVCTTQFPDLVVMLFALNEQNVSGVAMIARSIREADPERVSQIHFVATPVPNLPPTTGITPGDKRVQERRSLLAERMDVAAKKLGVKIDSSIRYYSLASLSEKLFVLDEGVAQQPFYGDYERLCRQITDFNRTGLDFLTKQADEFIREHDFDRLDRLAAVLERDYPDRAEAVYLRARFAVARNDTAGAIAFAEKAFAIDPAYEEPLDFLLDQYNNTDRYAQGLKLLDTVLARPELLSARRRYEVQQRRGEALMTLGLYREAADTYLECAEYAAAQNESPTQMMIIGFNAAEAHRRVIKRINAETWKQLLEIFDSAGLSSDGASPLQANRWQAMHIAYACLGDIAAAKDALRKANRVAQSVGELEDIFSVTSYRPVPVDEFLAINEGMLAALDDGELWDGMKLPKGKT